VVRESAQGDEALRSATFARGICSVRASDGSELLAVGASSGCVHVFDGSGFKFRHQHSTAREHAHAVSDLASHQDGRRSSSSSAQDEAHSGLLVSADDGGKIVVWRVDSCRDMAVQASVQVTTSLTLTLTR
jgi:WD40 repeat protein